jgi:hypothetical protein
VEVDGITGPKTSISGFIEAIRSQGLKGPGKTITSRVKLRLEAALEFEGLYGLASAQAERNWAIGSETGIDLHEVWIEHVGEGFDVRVGRQIIIWGKADGIQITDLVCPPDYTEFITRGLDEIRQPVEAARLRFLGRVVNLELIWIPFFRAGVSPRPGNPWYLGDPARGPGWEARELKPGGSLGDGEIAMKASAFLPGLDFAASVFYTHDDFPVLGPIVPGQGGTPGFRESRFRRMTVLGLEMSRPTGNLVIRAETAALLGQRRQNPDPLGQPVRQDGLKWLFGLDWTPGDDWTVSGQLAADQILGRNKAGLPPESYTATLNVSKKLFNQILTVTNMIYGDINNSGFYDSLKVEYEAMDGLIISVGTDIFWGHEGRFALYRDNSQAWAKVKYYF